MQFHGEVHDPVIDEELHRIELENERKYWRTIRYLGFMAFTGWICALGYAVLQAEI